MLWIGISPGCVYECYSQNNNLQENLRYHLNKLQFGLLDGKAQHSWTTKGFYYFGMQKKVEWITIKTFQLLKFHHGQLGITILHVWRDISAWQLTADRFSF